MRAKSIKEILNLCDGYYPSHMSPERKPEYFFNQNPDNFNSILDIYRLGKLHRTRNTCAITYAKYIEYWGFNEYHLEPCCAIEYYSEKDTGEKEREGETAEMERNKQKSEDENFGTDFLGRLRTFFWILTEYPELSVSARVRKISHSSFNFKSCKINVVHFIVCYFINFRFLV